MKTLPFDSPTGSELAEMVRAGRDAEVLKGLIAAGLDYRRATVWIRQCRIHNLYHPPRPCPRCGAMLRTNQAQQCFLCGADWHPRPAPGSHD